MNISLFYRRIISTDYICLNTYISFIAFFVFLLIIEIIKITKDYVDHRSPAIWLTKKFKASLYILIKTISQLNVFKILIVIRKI